MEGHHGATTRLLLCITQQDVLSLCPPHCMHEYQVPVRAIKDVEFEMGIVGEEGRVEQSLLSRRTASRLLVPQQDTQEGGQTRTKNIILNHWNVVVQCITLLLVTSG
jgi:hypothetical protein